MVGQILSEIENGIGWLTIDNPDKRNAVSTDMALQGTDLIAAFSADPNVRVVVIRSTGGKSWMAGADISEYEKRRGSPPLQRSGLAFYDGVRACPKPVVAMIAGYCFGGGFAMACACDIRLVADNSLFAIPAGRLGLGYRAEFTRWIVETVGIPIAREILYTGRRYDAANAYRIGLAHHIVPMAELESFTRDYVKTIVENAPLSVRASKGIINEVAKTPDDWDTESCKELLAACTASEDSVEGHRAFLEKRAPVFKGR
jgi:enoyl-CoA hydratase/carnithine racemase